VRGLALPAARGSAGRAVEGLRGPPKLLHYYGDPELARTRLRHAVEANPAQNTTGLPRPRHWVYDRAGRPCLRCGAPVAFAPAERTPHGRETCGAPAARAADPVAGRGGARRARGHGRDDAGDGATGSPPTCWRTSSCSISSATGPASPVG
jgi:hypothetical protein